MIALVKMSWVKRNSRYIIKITSGILFFSYLAYTLLTLGRETMELHYRERFLKKDHTLPEHVNIILYARYRGGSTFASEFFNKHNGIAFIYEPLCSNKWGGEHH